MDTKNIPEDVIDAARKAFENLPLGHQEGSVLIIASAILAERERCANKVEAFKFMTTDDRAELAAAIRLHSGE